MNKEQGGDALGGGEAAEDAMIEYELVDRTLPVALTDQERLQLGEEIVEAQFRGEQAEKDKKAADDRYKATIEEAYADVSGLAQRLRVGKKMTLVQCQIRRDYRLGHFRVIRLDDGSEVDARPMTSAERQLGMQFPKDGEEERG
jgi:hypothetical protein